MDAIREVFRHHDIYGDGTNTITKADLRNIVQKLGLPPEDVEYMFAAADSNADGRLDINEWTAWLHASDAAEGTSVSMNEVQRRFAHYDVNGDGHITQPEMERFLMKLGLPRDDACRLFASADINVDGHIDLNEFLSWIDSDQPGGARKEGVQDALLTRWVFIMHVPNEREHSWRELAYLAVIAASSYLSCQRPVVLALEPKEDDLGDAALDFLQSYMATSIVEIRARNDPSLGVFTSEHLCDDLDSCTITVASHWKSAPTIVVTSPDDRGNSILAASLAARINAPLFFLDAGHSLSTRVFGAISRLHPKQVLLVGPELHLKTSFKVTHLACAEHVMTWLLTHGYSLDYIAVIDLNNLPTRLNKALLATPSYTAYHEGLVVPLPDIEAHAHGQDQDLVPGNVEVDALREPLPEVVAEAATEEGQLAETGGTARGREAKSAHRKSRSGSKSRPRSRSSSKPRTEKNRKGKHKDEETEEDIATQGSTEPNFKGLSSQELNRRGDGKFFEFLSKLFLKLDFQPKQILIFGPVKAVQSSEHPDAEDIKSVLAGLQRCFPSVKANWVAVDCIVSASLMAAQAVTGSLR